MFLKSKKGSLVLSFVASGAVVATIVAAHKITQQYSSGTSQGFGRARAFQVAQRYIGLAALMVSRNVILCSGKIVYSQNELKRVGCKGYGPLLGDDIASSFYDDLNLSPLNFTVDKVGTGDSAHNYRITLNKIKDVKSPFYELSSNDTSSSQDKIGSITWSLKSWKENPSVRTVLMSVNNDDGGFYICRNEKTGEVHADGVCSSLSVEKNMQAILDGQSKCKDSSNNDIADTVCDYVFSADNDGYMVYISVTVPYSEASSGGGSNVKSLLQLNGAIRRPLARVSFSGENRPVCSMRCESNGDGGIGLNTNPQCVGLSDYGSNTTTDDARYEEGVLLAQNSFKVQNHGPGVLYYLKLKREDLTDSDRVLYQTMVKANGVNNLRPFGTAEVQDKLPCYIPSFYRVSVNRVNCTCSFRWVGANGRGGRRGGNNNPSCTALGGPTTNTVTNPQTGAVWPIAVNSVTRRVQNCSSTQVAVVPRSCAGNVPAPCGNLSTNPIVTPAAPPANPTPVCNNFRLNTSGSLCGRSIPGNNQQLNIQPSFDMF